MASGNGRRMSNRQEADYVERQLDRLVTVIRRREEEGNFVDCESVVKATVLVISGRSANEAMGECGIPVGENE